MSSNQKNSARSQDPNQAAIDWVVSQIPSDIRGNKKDPEEIVRSAIAYQARTIAKHRNKEPKSSAQDVLVASNK